VQHGVLERMRAIEETHWWFRARQEILLSLLRRWVPGGSRILDVGCGTGYFLNAAQKEWEVWGLDPAPEAVAYCQGRGLSRVSVGSVADLGKPTWPSFQAICFFDVLEHLDDDLATLKSTATMLCHGGLVLATVPAYRWLWSSHDTQNHHRRRYTRGQLREVLELAGFTPLELGYYNSRLFPLALVQRTVDRIRPRPAGEHLPLPAPFLNEALYRVLRSERSRLTGAKPRPFSFGLSLLAVAQVRGNGVVADGSSASS
jgi:SAM-dependent methyltransferase